MTDAVAAAQPQPDNPTFFRQAMLLATVTFVTMLYAMTVTIANVSLPQMQGSLSTTPDQIAWIVTFNIVATAIVTPIEGTTRDVLREHIQIDGMPLHIVDTAGLRDSGDEIEQEGIRRAWQEMETADRILLVVDGNQTSPAGADDPDAIWPEKKHHLTRDIPVTIVKNKCDLSGSRPSLVDTDHITVIELSAKSDKNNANTNIYMIIKFLQYFQ